MRALWADVGAGKVVEGGSTISQQLVRNMYTGRERTFERKVKEACLAIKLSDRWSKDKILRTYLNTVYYGNHAYGVEAARRDLLLAPGTQPEPCPVGADRRAPAGAVDLRPAPQPAGRARAPRRGAARDARRRRDHAAAVRVGDAAAAPPEAGRDLHADQAAVLLLLRDRRARERLRREHRSRGRPARLHDDRAEAPGGGERRDPRRRSTSRTTRPPRSSPSSPAPARSGR